MTLHIFEEKQIGHQDPKGTPSSDDAGVFARDPQAYFHTFSP